jgi:broad specificity phosphatase PhoE
LLVRTSTLRELNNGIAANQTREAAKDLERPMTDPVLDWVPYPQGESWRAMHERAVLFLREISVEDVETAIVVSHSNMLKALIHGWLESTEETLTKVSFEIDVCSITRLTINEFAERTISKLNDTCHLQRG